MPDLSGLSGDQLDKTFLQYMIPHHMMAIMMSQQLLMHGEARHPEVAAFAPQGARRPVDGGPNDAGAPGPVVRGAEHALHPASARHDARTPHARHDAGTAYGNTRPARAPQSPRRQEPDSGDICASPARDAHHGRQTPDGTPSASGPLREPHRLRRTDERDHWCDDHERSRGSPATRLGSEGGPIARCPPFPESTQKYLLCTEFTIRFTRDAGSPRQGVPRRSHPRVRLAGRAPRHATTTKAPRHRPGSLHRLTPGLHQPVSPMPQNL